MKIIPANFPIHVDARFPCIIYKTYAPVPSSTLPPTMTSYENVPMLGPKIVTRICPLRSMDAAVRRMIREYLS